MANSIDLTPESAQIFESLKEDKATLKKNFGVIRIGVFGRIPKTEVIDNADVNILVELNNPRLDLWTRLKNYLESRLEQPINLIAKGSQAAERLALTNKKVRKLVAFA
ncbi:MAG: hypothetical protein AAGI38_00665 [Bacteroidota bacterium]